MVYVFSIIHRPLPARLPTQGVCLLRNRRISSETHPVRASGPQGVKLFYR